ncbi:hypothetical protein FisN_13Lh223 [Fistulifera solaris]|uniref:Thioredoxin domain-containing protein n=1 Tax=Fistulifera solaris TaxID=1519565 RepID=A0A1Z5KMH1_FISSO|nr:hypothetical protein FisN_13Lh223 [Fistulifera solaris]|eukprot:GAX27221.1 hypothetical protein FisN_13Lh223 [Fistulifera solaris]
MIELPRLPLICLDTAEETNTHEITCGQHTVIDFWTTRCTNCPDALNKLQHLAATSSNVRFASICCDSLDGAREIIGRHDDMRWSSVHHYFMEHVDKELCKHIFGFKQVPFYVVLNAQNEITQYGNKINWDPIYSLIGLPVGPQTDENAKPPTNVNVVSSEKSDSNIPKEDTHDDFVIEDLDF